MYKYRVDVTRVVDGDTVDVDIDLGFGMVYKKQRVRMMGIDTPESRTRDLEEKFYGKQSKANLIKILDGKSLAKATEESIAKQVNDLNNKGISPTLTTILIGQDHRQARSRLTIPSKIGLQISVQQIL